MTTSSKQSWFLYWAGFFLLLGQKHVRGCWRLLLFLIRFQRNQAYHDQRDNQIDRSTKTVSPADERQRLQVSRVFLLYEQAHAPEKAQKDAIKQQEAKKRKDEEESRQVAKRAKQAQTNTKVASLLAKMKK